MTACEARPSQGRTARSDSRGTSSSIGENRRPRQFPEGERARRGPGGAWGRAVRALPLNGYRRAAYAVISSVTATSANSGFVQVMRNPPLKSTRRRPRVDHRPAGTRDLLMVADPQGF